MSGDIRGLHSNGIRHAIQLSVVGQAGVPARVNGGTRSSGGTSFGAPIVETSRYSKDVSVVANQYSSFDDALLPMVLATGVTGDAALNVCEAIRNNEALRAQAQRAFQKSRMSAV